MEVTVAGRADDLPGEVGGVAGIGEEAGVADDLGDDALRAGLRQSGPRRASQFTWTAAAQATRRALEQAYRPDAGRRARYPSPSVPR